MEKRFYSQPEVAHMYGISKATIYRLVAQGRFPEPVQISRRRVGWSASSLAEHDKRLSGKEV